MTNSPLAAALQRQADNPQIHKKVPSIKSGEAYESSLVAMVRDLKINIPELSIRQISSLTCASRSNVHRILGTVTPEHEWSSDDNETSATEELAALRSAHPDRQYEDDENAGPEPLVFFSAPLPRDPHRRADQSHTLPRPITLPTAPFSVAA